MSLKDNFSLKINKIEYIDKLKATTLNVSKSLDDYTFEFELDVFKSDLDLIEVGAEVILIDNNVIIAGGILYDVGIKTGYTDENNNKKLSLSVKVDNYTNLCQKILIEPINLEEGDIDHNLNYAENIFIMYFNKYLKSYGFTIGEVKTNLTIDEMNLDDFKSNMSLKEVFNKLADLTHSEYYINTKKQFNVYRGIANFKTIEQITNEDDLLDLEIKRTMQDYRNRVKVIGGDATVETPDEYVNEDGKMVIIVEDKQEQERIKRLIGGDGIFSSEETNDNITNVDELKNHANLILNKYSRPPLTINFKINSIQDNCGWVREVESGDFIKLKIPTFLKGDDYETIGGSKLDYIYCCIDSVNITDDFGENIIYELEVSRRKDNTPNKGLIDILNPNTEGNTITNNNPNGSINSDNINIQINNTITTAVEVRKFDIEGNPVE